ncbi:MAG: hypothetical protein ACOC8C_00745 [Chloroflexota bacterium]
MFKLELPDELVVDVCNPRPMEAAPEPAALLRMAIKSGFGKQSLGRKTGIIRR